MYHTHYLLMNPNCTHMNIYYFEVLRVQGKENILDHLKGVILGIHRPIWESISYTYNCNRNAKMQCLTEHGHTLFVYVCTRVIIINI